MLSKIGELEPFLLKTILGLNVLDAHRLSVAEGSSKPCRIGLGGGGDGLELGAYRLGQGTHQARASLGALVRSLPSSGGLPFRPLPAIGGLYSGLCLQVAEFHPGPCQRLEMLPSGLCHQVAEFHSGPCQRMEELYSGLCQ